MSAVLLGKRNSAHFFEEISHHASPFPTSKKARFQSLSPSNCTHLTPLERLRAIFPETEEQILVEELEACGNDIESTVMSLKEFRSRAGKEGLDSADGSKWIGQLVSEMMKARDISDARARASIMLKSLEESMMMHATIKATQYTEKENMVLKEQVAGLLRDNNILKKAVAIQHERQKELQTKTLEGNQEIQHLKLLVSQYQQQMQTLEINNYSLSMHLRQAQQGSSMPTRFHPDVF